MGPRVDEKGIVDGRTRLVGTQPLPSPPMTSTETPRSGVKGGGGGGSWNPRHPRVTLVPYATCTFGGSSWSYASS